MAIRKIPEVARILFLPQWLEIEFIFTLWSPVSKIAIFGMKLGHWPKLHVHPRSTPGPGSQLSLFLLYGQPFPRYVPISKLPYLFMNLGHWQKCNIYSSLHPLVEIEIIFCSTGSGFRDMEAKPKKALADIFDVDWRWPFLHGFRLGRIHPYTFTTHYMPEKWNFCPHKAAFGRFQFQIRLPDTFPNHLQPI